MNEQLLEEYLKGAFNVLVIVTVLAWLLAWQKRKVVGDNPIHWLIYLLGLLAFLAVTEWALINIVFKKSFPYYGDIKPILKAHNIHNTSFINPPSYLAKFVLLGLFFRDLIHRAAWKKCFQVVMWALVLFELVQVFVFKSYQSYNSLSSTVKNIFIIAGSSWFLYRFYQTDTGTIPLYKNPYFWITLGLLIPALAEIFLEFIFSTLQQTDTVMFYKLYIVRNIIQIFSMMLIMTGFWHTKYLKFLKKEY